MSLDRFTKPMNIKIRFRVPPGEELTRERLDALEPFGVTPDLAHSPARGLLVVTLDLDDMPGHVSEEDEIAQVEDLIEAMLEETGDMEMLRYRIGREG